MNSYEDIKTYIEIKLPSTLVFIKNNALYFSAPDTTLDNYHIEPG